MALKQLSTTIVGKSMHFVVLIKTSQPVRSTITALASDRGTVKCRQTPTAAKTHPFAWPVQLIAFLGLCNFAVCVCLSIFLLFEQVKSFNSSVS